MALFSRLVNGNSSSRVTREKKSPTKSAKIAEKKYPGHFLKKAVNIG